VEVEGTSQRREEGERHSREVRKEKNIIEKGRRRGDILKKERWRGDIPEEIIGRGET